jgi:hypothetical protein
MNKLLILFLILSFELPNIMANEFVAKVLHTKGSVFLSVLNGPFGSINKGDLLSEGNKVKTGESGLVIIRFPDKSIMRVGPSSEVEIEEVVERVSNESLGKTSLILKSGRVLINVLNKSKAPIFKVKTRYAAIGVRGTSFLTSIDQETSNVDVAVDKGEVEVRSNLNDQTAEALDAGQGITLEKGEVFTLPLKYDWIKKINFDAGDKKIEPSYFKEFDNLKKIEFRKKRQAWKKNLKKWSRKVNLWERRKSEYSKNVKRLLRPREEFRKRKNKFLKNKKKLDLERNKHFKSIQKIQSDVKSLKSDKEIWKKSVSDFKKSGSKDKKILAKLLEEKKSLNKRTRGIKARMKNERGVASSIRVDQGEMSKLFKKSYKKFEKKKITKNVRKQINRKIEKKSKKSMSKILDKGLKGFFK